jgi:hypothetical protein
LFVDAQNAGKDILSFLELDVNFHCVLEVSCEISGSCLRDFSSENLVNSDSVSEFIMIIKAFHEKGQGRKS